MAKRVKYDKHYADSPKACGEPFDPFVQFVEELDQPVSVLDLGCGQGRDALLFARAGHSVFGIDLSTVGIGQLLEAAQAEDLDLRAEVHDVVSFVPADSHDVVLLDRVLHMLSDDQGRTAVLGRAAEATLSGGFILVSEYPKQVPLVRAFFAEQAGWTLCRDARGFVFAQKVTAAVASPD
jgi:SAM-dependent methyltransferase